MFFFCFVAIAAATRHAMNIKQIYITCARLLLMFINNELLLVKFNLDNRGPTVASLQILQKTGTICTVYVGVT